VHITSADPVAKPAINPSFFSNLTDKELMARQVQYLAPIASTEPFKSKMPEDGTKHKEPCSHFLNMGDAKDYLCVRVPKQIPTAGACSMIPCGICGIIDSRLIVYGTSNLRVIDTSIMPIIPKGNIQSSVYAIAERAADLIKAKHDVGNA
jgi:choline dehydrogenase-like flavoprotein